MGVEGKFVDCNPSFTIRTHDGRQEYVLFPTSETFLKWKTNFRSVRMKRLNSIGNETTWSIAHAVGDDYGSLDDGGRGGDGAAALTPTLLPVGIRIRRRRLPKDAAVGRNPNLHVSAGPAEAEPAMMPTRRRRHRRISRGAPPGVTAKSLKADDAAAKTTT